MPARAPTKPELCPNSNPLEQPQSNRAGKTLVETEPLGRWQLNIVILLNAARHCSKKVRWREGDFLRGYDLTDGAHSE